MIENWFVHQSPFEYEYEYRSTEYEYDEDRNTLMPDQSDERRIDMICLNQQNRFNDK